MKKFLCYSLSLAFAFGVLFPVSRTSEGKSAFVQDIKKLFHFSSGYERKVKTEKAPFVTDKGGAGIFQEIRNIFHYFPEEKKPKTKKSPLSFDKLFKRGSQEDVK